VYRLNCWFGKTKPNRQNSERSQAWFLGFPRADLSPLLDRNEPATSKAMTGPGIAVNSASRLGSAGFSSDNRDSGATASWPARNSPGFVGGKSALTNCCTGANHSSVRLGTQRSRGIRVANC
jgi:hypothetical protein